MRANEELAACAHEAWTRRLRYLLRRTIPNSDGTLTIPHEVVLQLRRQVSTAYQDLPAREKKSSRAEAIRIMQVFLGDDEPV